MKHAYVLLLAAWSAGCVYYNAMWSAERFAKDARRFERRGQTSEARSQWALAAAKAERVVQRHPRSRWADDALTLQAEGLARSGACDEAATPIERVRETVSDLALRERVALAAAECALAAARPVQAESALVLPLASRDDARRSRAELLAGQTAEASLDFAGAAQHFERSREPAARTGRARVLIAAGRSSEASAVIASLTGPEYGADRADLLARLASAAGPEPASAALDRLLERGKRMPFHEQARLLITDAERRLANGDAAEAIGRYRRAGSVAPAATAEAVAAAAGEQQVLLADVKRRSELEPIEAELARLSREPGGASAKRLLDLVRLASLVAETPAAGFRGAELARDSLGAPALAGDLFLALAARDTASLYAPKALVAAIAMIPELRDSIVRVLETRYAASPYTRAFHGQPSIAYAAAEDSLAREMGVQVSGGTLAPAAARGRTALPVPGPRGPKLDDVPAPPAASPPRRAVPAGPARDRPVAQPDRP